ncbi:MAG: hypothetical protein GY772_21340, partial [bacterium]|nr:hypothetical protein [bacterium]
MASRRPVSGSALAECFARQKAVVAQEAIVLDIDADESSESHTRLDVGLIDAGALDSAGSFGEFASARWVEVEPIDLDVESCVVCEDPVEAVSDSQE